MRIALYYNLTPGGADRALFEIIKRLSLKHKIDTYTLDIKNKKQKLLLRNIPGTHFKFKINLPDNFLFFQVYIFTRLLRIHKQIAGKINKGKYDIVLLSDDYLTKSPLLLRFLKIPSVYFCQTHYREFYDPSLIFSRSLKYKIINFLRYPLKWMNKKNFQAATFIVANSKYIQERLTQIHQRKIYRIKLGVEGKRFKKKCFKRDNFFLSVGPLAIFKGMAFLIKAISFLPKNERLPLVVVANGGRDEKYIKKLANNLGVDLRIKPWLSDQKLIELYNRAKIFLYTPYYEPFGLVVLEAMACGLPVVGVNEGGLKESIIEGKNGWLSERDPRRFSLKISEALKKVNPEFRKNTRNSTKDWDWNKSALMLEKIILKISKKNK